MHYRRNAGGITIPEGTTYINGAIISTLNVRFYDTAYRCFQAEASANVAGDNRLFNGLKRTGFYSGVQKFECLKQISPKNKFDFGLSMEFDNAADYEQYTNHPDHVHFVQKYWMKNVDDFLEIDYEPVP